MNEGFFAALRLCGSKIIAGTMLSETTSCTRSAFTLQSDLAPRSCWVTYSLVLTALNPSHVSEAAEDKFARVKAVPAIYLAMVGVTDECAGGGIGSKMVRDAIKRSLAIAEIAGAYALALDALDDEVANMYRALGFELFVEGERKMFLELSEARAALA